MFDTIWDKLDRIVIFFGPFFWGALVTYYLKGGISDAAAVGMGLFGGFVLTALNIAFLCVLEDFVFWCKHHNDPEN